MALRPPSPSRARGTQTPTPACGRGGDQVVADADAADDATGAQRDADAALASAALPGRRGDPDVGAGGGPPGGVTDRGGEHGADHEEDRAPHALTDVGG